MNRILFFIAVFMLTVCFSMSYGIEKVVTPSLDITGIMKSGISNPTYSLQRSSSTKEVHIGVNKYNNDIGRGQLIFDLSDIPSDATINSVSLYISSKLSNDHDFGRKISIYYTNDPLRNANATAWGLLDPNSVLKIVDVDMQTFGYTAAIHNNSKLKDMTKACFGSQIIMNIVHNEVGKGLVLDVRDQRYIALVINYTPKAVENKITISGPSTIEEGARATYTATYTGSGAIPSTYAWSFTNNKLRIVSGANTKTITVEAPTGGATTDVVKVTAGGVSSSKSVSITSSTVYITGQTITTNKNYSGKVIDVSNTTISNNAKVNMTATEKVVIKPSTHFREGTTVVIKATGATRSLVSGLQSEEDVTEIYEYSVVDDPAIYPNPVRDQLTVNFGNSTDLIDCLEVYDATGSLVMKNFVNSDQQTISVNNYTDGMYILRIIYKNGEYKVKKFIVAK